MKILTTSVMLLALALGQSAAAGDRNGNGGMMGNDRFMPGMRHGPGTGPHMGMGGAGMMKMGHGGHAMMMGRLQPPSLLMRYQDEIGLSAKQVDAVKQATKDFETGKVDARWELESARTALRRELDRDSIDADRALSLLDRVTAAETSLKKQHLAMLIAVHNVLTPDQVQQLNTLVHRPFGMHEFHGAPPSMQSPGDGS